MDGLSAREVPVIAELTLDHQAHHLRPARDGFVVASREGAFTALDGRLRVTRRGELGPVTDLAIGPRWAWIAGQRLWVGDPEDPRPGIELPGESACRWDGDRLWTANAVDDQVRVALDGQEVVVLPDEFGSSNVMLYPHPDPGAVVVWIAAGQDGQESWLVRAGGDARHLPADDCGPAVFLGDWLLTADDDRLARCDWPARTDPPDPRELAWDDVDPGGEDMPGGGLLVLPGGFVTWSSGNGRIRIVDLVTMAVVDEVALAGHPLRTVAEVYPSLAGDDSPCTDFHHAVSGVDTVLSVHRNNTVVLSTSVEWVPVTRRRASP